MTTPYAQPYPHHPPAPHPMSRANTADVIVTSLMMATHVAIVGLSTFFSMFYAMASDPCGSGTACDTDNIGWAFAVTDLGGVGVLLAASIVAVVLMVRRRIAFWVPLAGIAAHVGLMALSFSLLDAVVP